MKTSPGTVNPVDKKAPQRSIPDRVRRLERAGRSSTKTLTSSDDVVQANGQLQLNDMNNPYTTIEEAESAVLGRVESVIGSGGATVFYSVGDTVRMRQYIPPGGSLFYTDYDQMVSAETI